MLAQLKWRALFRAHSALHLEAHTETLDTLAILQQVPTIIPPLPQVPAVETWLCEAGQPPHVSKSLIHGPVDDSCTNI